MGSKMSDHLRPELSGRCGVHMKSGCLVAVAFLLICGSGISSWGQTDRGTITGTVTDSSGAVLANAKVTAKATNTGAERSTTTSDEGSYTLPELPAAPYEVRATAKGFKSATKEFAAGSAGHKPRGLQAGCRSGGESITVTAEAQAIQTGERSHADQCQRKAGAGVASASERGVWRAHFLSPLSSLNSSITSTTGTGVTSRGTDASTFRVNGGQAQGTAILIDGAGTQRAQNGTFFSEVGPGPDAFQEFTISTSSYSSEFGSSSGGVVNFTIKSGSNGYHGEAYDLLRNTSLNANSFINNSNKLPRNIDREMTSVSM